MSEKIDGFYAKWAGAYDLMYGKVFQEGREVGVKCLQMSPGEKVLEVGVGTGICISLYPADYKLVGIDFSGEMLAKAAERTAANNCCKVTLLQMDACEMSFADDEFDKVFVPYVVSVVPDPVKLIMEIRRVCKPQGDIVFANHFRSDSGLVGKMEDVLSPLCNQIGFHAGLDLSALLAQTDLEIEWQRRVNPLGWWKVVWCKNPS